ncbi:MAG: hypothetical protein R3E39_16240 [Anaerolineae bacterium]
MNYQVSTITFESAFGSITHNLFLQHDPLSDKLLVVLPGRAYTFDFPALYHLREAALQLGYDVLSIEYGFQAGHKDFEATQSGFLMDDVMGVLTQVNMDSYKRVAIAGKSLGSPLAAELARSMSNVEMRLLLLTPIGGAVQGLGDIHTLAVIGTADPLYSADEVAGFEHHPTIKWRVFEGLNHGLEVPSDWRGSLSVLPEIIGVCANFLAR